MFFRHPKPVVDPRPVAELSVPMRVRARPNSDHTLFIGPAAQTPDALHIPSLRVPPQVATDRPIAFMVRYGLQEYRSLIEDYLPIALKERGVADARPGALTWLLLRAAVPTVFFFKRWRVGNCRFEMDVEGLARHSRNGVLRLAWSDLRAVHRFRQGYLLEMDRGAVPLPYRCFRAGERERLEAWLGKTDGSTQDNRPP